MTKPPFWQATRVPCPNCKTPTPSDAVDWAWAHTQATIDMTYTCRQCRTLFVARVSTEHTGVAPVVIGREARG